MKRSRFSEEQVIAILKEQEAGAKTAEVCRRRGGRKRAVGTRAPLALPSGPNQRWSLDFLSDALGDGRRFRILAVVDDFTRECLALVADTSLPGMRVVRELEALVSRRGRPLAFVSDNGTELTSLTMLKWAQDSRVEWHYFAPRKPQQNCQSALNIDP
jgi:putative transposase